MSNGFKFIGRAYWIKDYAYRPRVVKYEPYVFDYCTNKTCDNSKEHEIFFDGQFFYKTLGGKK